MKTTERRDRSVDDSDESQNIFEERMETVLSMLPAGARPIAEKGVTWIKDHPIEAVLIGTAGGFTLGILGIARTLVAGRLLRSVPSVLPVLMAGANTLVQAFETKTPGERVTH